jgi:hypothetical protein
MNININRDDSGINDFLIIFDSMKSRPSRVILHDRFSGKEFNDIIESFISSQNLEKNFLTEYIPSDDDYIINEKVLLQIDENIWISYLVMNKQSEDYIINEVCFYYRSVDQQDHIEKMVVQMTECIVDYEDESNKINTLSMNSDNLIDLEPLLISEIDTENMYSDAVIKKIDKLVKVIKKDSKGLSIFTGEKGLGKTNMCKYVASKVDKMSIFIPNNMIEQTVNSPDFKRFLSRFEKTLVIIDDCEFLYNPVFGRMNHFTNSILQLVDGFMSEHLNTHFLLVFNTTEEELDENLLDCNNLIDVVEFDMLSSEMATELSKSLGVNKKHKNETRLLDVVNSKKKNNIKEDIGLK